MSGKTDEAGARLAILHAIDQLPPGDRVREVRLGVLADGTGWYWEVQTVRRIGNTASIEYADRSQNRDASQGKAKAAVVTGATSWGGE